MTLSKFYVNIEPPQSKKVLWIKPLEDGFALYIWFRDKWLLLKILDDNGTPIIFDDTTLDFYTKEEVDNKLADILGLDAEGVAELKALIEDDDSLTGLLGELNKKANVVLLSDYIDSDNPLPTDCIYKRIVGGSGREFKYLLPKEVKYSEDSYLIFKISDDTDESFVYTVFKREHRTTTMQYYYNASYNTSTDEVPTWVEDAFGYTRSEIDAKIPESIEDLSDGDRVDNIEKALSESLALYDFSDNQQHAQSPNLLFYYNNPKSLIGELNLYWNWPSEVGSQTYYVAWNSGSNGNYIYAKKGTITMKVVTYVDRRISSYPDLLIRWGADTQYHVGAQWPYGEETIYTSNDYQEIGTWVVRNITFEVPNDGYLFGFGNVFTLGNNMFAVLYINLSSEQLVEVSELPKKIDNLETALNEVEYANFYEEAESAGTSQWITPTSTQHLTFSEQMRTCNISPVTIDGKSYSSGLSILDAFDQQNPPVTVHVEDAGIVTFYIIGDSTIYANPNITVKTKLDSESTYVKGETYNVSTQGYGRKISVEMSSSGNIVLEYLGSWAIHDGSTYAVISMITYEGKEKHLINVGALKSSVDQLIPIVNNLAETKLNFIAATTTNYTALKNTYYRHGTLSSLSIALPSDSLSAGDICIFSFTTSSSFPSGGFTLSSTPYTQKKMKDFTIEASKIYEVVALYNGAMWLVTVTEFE